jgi:uncharacterized protein YeaC (DUF1315 family)
MTSSEIGRESSQGECLTSEKKDSSLQRIVAVQIRTRKPEINISLNDKSLYEYYWLHWKDYQVLKKYLLKILLLRIYLPALHTYIHIN